MELSNAQTCLKVEGLIFAIKKKKERGARDLCRFLKNILTFL